MDQDLIEISIVLCGSPRVGKSSLINAICQQQLAENDVILDSCTKQLKKYQVEYTKNNRLHRTIFWDLPGIESWSEIDVRDHINKLITEKKPLCVIYCASPGSFAKLEHVKWLTSECADRKIFCALVCTNMWSGRNRHFVLNEFREILRETHPNIQYFEDNKIIYFGNVGLCTMVNSKTYIDDDLDIRREPSGINELISGIGKCLDEEHKSIWFQMTSENQLFWSQIDFDSKHTSSEDIDRQHFTTKSSFQPMDFRQSSDLSRSDSTTSQNESTYIASSITSNPEHNTTPIENNINPINSTSSFTDEIPSTEKQSSTASHVESTYHHASEQFSHHHFEVMDSFSSG